MGNRHLPLTSIATILVVLFLFADVLAQKRDKPKLKDFGSSLKRLRWDEQKKAAVDVKSKSDSPADPTATEVVKVETSLVSSDLLVLDERGNAVTNLTASDFPVTEDGTPQTVGMFSLGDNATVSRSIVLIIDYGCSQLPFVNASVAAAKIMVDKLSPNDRMAIVTDDIELLSDFTSNKEKLKQKLDELRRRTSLKPFTLEPLSNLHAPFGRGFQYSALMAVLKEAFSEEDQRPIIIFQTDGTEAALLRNPITGPTVEPGLPPDLRAQREANLQHFADFRKRNPREFSMDDIYKATERSRATIYTIVPGLRFIGLKPEERAPQMRAYFNREIVGFDLPGARKMWDDILKRWPEETFAFEADVFVKLQSALAVLSTVSGGWIDFFDQPSQANEIYSRIFSDINRRYVVGYYSTNKAHDGKRRKVSIAVWNHPEYIVMGHRGYYAPGPE
ncbi:MAG TPA: VWA domain-containing protein [Pyrinomonadaceae bacterium]|nr:VWA domain-containing protein [Pyrinomonadaceae bacterium]